MNNDRGNNRYHPVTGPAVWDEFDGGDMAMGGRLGGYSNGGIPPPPQISRRGAGSYRGGNHQYRGGSVARGSSYGGDEHTGAPGGFFGGYQGSTFSGGAYSGGAGGYTRY